MLSIGSLISVIFSSFLSGISEEISIRVIERGLENKTKAEQSLEFVNKIFEENPECNIIHEMVVKAEESLVDREYEKVESFATSALDSCKDILSESRKSIERPAGVFLGRGDIIIISLSIVMILSVIILKIVTDVVRSRKKKQVGKKKK